MIKVMIVEDDKLVRKNLVRTLNWKLFGMEVVADAKNGEKALEELDNTAVDLIITDLAMPIMSGIELIRVVKEQYPEIFIVVLSLHRDFEYIQEAMRLGAIDYIAKVELDDQSMDQTLRRIQDRIKKEQLNYPADTLFPDSLDGALVVLANQRLNTLFHRNSLIQEKDMSFVTDEIMIIRPNKVTIEQLIKESKRICSIDMSACLLIMDQTVEDLEAWKQQLMEDKDQLLFYTLAKNQAFAKRKWSELSQWDSATEETIETMAERLLTLEWIGSNHALHNLLVSLKGLHLSKQRLNELMMVTMNECNRIYKDILAVQFSIPKTFSYWRDIEIWMTETMENIHQSFFNQAYSEETISSIVKAIALIDQSLDEQITAIDIAKRVNMSRSYFSVCFKNVTSYTFNEYVRLIRMERAKHHLVYSREKIGKISEKVGYQDIKYFSKLFREETGHLPSEYRKLYKGEANVSRL
ncbi:response regulator transcription factor [Gracilibacillus phocaeensis]|uniref:response regulator transcription factor n=1 Tax=Gracilibacillus phocaeensis TaxID=2042304 RepID=UPI0013EF1DBA|nr:response regulator [Gracilibacillus phocaeensis]